MASYKQSWRRRWLVVVVLSLALVGVVVFVSGSLRPVRFAVNFLSQPVERIFSFLAFKTDSMFSVFHSVGGIRSENERLLSENIRLQSEVAKLSFEGEENKVLRDQLGVPQKHSFDTVSSEVIGRTYTDSGRWVMVNRGISDGVAKGMPVIVGEGLLVGFIDEVSPDSSRVMLLTHPDSVLSAEDESSKAQGVVRGAFGLGLLFDRIPQADSLMSGDRIITFGSEKVVPSGLLIGTIDEVRTTPDRLFRQGTIKTVIPFEKLRFVRIIRSW